MIYFERVFYHFSHFVASGTLAMILTQTLANMILAEQQHQLGGYKFSCTYPNACDSTRNFTCNTSISRCVCAQHPDPDYMFIFDVHVSACVPILVEHKHEFWRCEDEFYNWNSTRLHEHDSALGFCKSHHECQVAHNSTSLRCDLTSCSCECLLQHPETGLKLILPAPNVNTTALACVYKPIKCRTHSICEQEYGQHSGCNLYVASCHCKQRSRFFHGQCVRERAYGESCHYDIECEFGMGQYSRCDGNGTRPKCECVTGFQLDTGGTGKCVVVVNPKAESVRQSQTHDHDHNCLTVPLIIMLVVCIISIISFFIVSVCWFRQSKLCKKSNSYLSIKFKKFGFGRGRARKNKGIEMSPSFLSSKDLDEGLGI